MTAKQLRDIEDALTQALLFIDESQQKVYSDLFGRGTLPTKDDTIKQLTSVLRYFEPTGVNAPVSDPAPPA